MKLLLHTCCGPCTIYRVAGPARRPVRGHGFFLPQQHPSLHRMSPRAETLTPYAESIALKMIVPAGYAPEGFCAMWHFRETDRCTFAITTG